MRRRLAVRRSDHGGGAADQISPEGKEIIEAAGRTLTPAFIDVHSHADKAPLLLSPDASKILQGVTTEVVGNCGFSLAPRSREPAEASWPPMPRLTSPV